MTKQKTTKRMLLSSVLSLVLCITMLIGTTFAWFTDTAASKGNKIQAGSLKIDLELLEKNADGSTTWTSIKESQDPIFAEDILWEPGYTDVKILRVENEGNLALKWVARFVSGFELTALADVIDVYVCPSETTELTYPENRKLDGYTRVGTVREFVTSFSDTTHGVLLPKDDKGEDGVAYLGLALKMQESAGNEYQGMSLGGAFDIQIFATQYTEESDSFDNQYDADAPEVFTVNGVTYEDATSALAAANDGDEVYLSSVTEPIIIDKKMELTITNTNISAEAGVNAITVNKEATIVVEGYNKVVGGKNADGIYVNEGVTLTITGKGRLEAQGNGGSETQNEYNSKIGGSGIDVNGTIAITDLSALTAAGYGYHAFGIGGSTESITIKNSTINYAKGGMVKTAIEDKNYGKSEPEAGAAIGSNLDGAVIEITNSTVKKAEGGSKAAGIGAMYHTGVTVNITDSNVTAIGGTSSAGIGGSRITKYESAESQAINITIKNSTVNATGGDFAAGIGSGYNTYTNAVRPIITVEIDEKSSIIAKGGLLGAGVGTGHNCVDFVNKVACDTKNIQAGSSEDPSWCCWGNPCSEAQDVGLGVYSINHFYTKISEGLYTDKSESGKYYVFNADGFEQLNKKMIDKTAGKNAVVKLCANIDMTGKTWTPVDSHADTAFWLSEFDGQGFTISNLTIDGQAMFKRFAGVGDVVIKDVTFYNATVTTSGINASILTVQTYQNTLLDNVDVKKSAITGAYKVAPLVGTVYNESESSSITCTVKNCDISDTVVTSTQYDFCTCGMISFVYTTDNDFVEYEKCSITNVQLKSVGNGYEYHANIHYTSADTNDQINEHPGVTVTKVTFEKI